MKESIHHRVQKYACEPWESAAEDLGGSRKGLRQDQVQSQRQKYGSNEQIQQKDVTVAQCVRRAFINPFSIILFVLAVISLFTGIFLPQDYGQSNSSVIMIVAILILSGVLRLIQQLLAKQVSDRLTSLVEATVAACRNGVWVEIPFEDVVVGDLVRLAAGDRVPADIRLCTAKDLFASQSVMTGESKIVEKIIEPMEQPSGRISDYTNTIFQGATIAGGSGTGIVVAVGSDTFYGSLSTEPIHQKESFDQNTNSVAWVLIKFIAILVPIVFVACGLTKGNWLAAFLFALSVAVGLTPELLPMVVTACLAKGSAQMGLKQTVVKNINAMQTLGTMDVLCVDKTGTLTGDTVTLEYYLDILGNQCDQVLDYGFLNSYYHTGVKNHLDSAILYCRNMPGKELHFMDLPLENKLLDELPFDYSRRFAGVLVQGEESNLHIIKGSVRNVVQSCRYIDYRGQVLEMGEDTRSSVHAIVDELTEEGMKVLAVAYRKTDATVLTAKETDFILLGYLAFFDAPKESAARAMESLRNLEVGVRVLTGDETNTAVSICRRLGIRTDTVLTGSQISELSENEFPVRVEHTTLFTELSPKQKATIIETLQNNGHCVGFLGDGMNDLPGQMQADVSISVDTAAETIQESADVILLKKDLNILEEGILQGRKAFVNMTKYIKITASSNLGNIISVAIASILLPFFPMTSVQLLLLNLIYDILCLVLPWDNVDVEQLQHPIRWVGKTLGRFMLQFGPVSSVFDLLTFVFLFFVLCPWACGGAYTALTGDGQLSFIALFQTGWFLESIWSQILILHLLRTPKKPFAQSKPSRPVLLVTLAGLLLCTAFTLTPFSKYLGMTRMPVVYFLFLIAVVLCYLGLASLVKHLYHRKYRELL